MHKIVQVNYMNQVCKKLKALHIVFFCKNSILFHPIPLFCIKIIIRNCYKTFFLIFYNTTVFKWNILC